jgi:hypothetical protein
MACISPPALTDGQLLAYVEDDADADTVAHIRQCPYCRERAQDLAQVHRQMAAQLYRAACPATLELGEYELGLLPSAQMFTIQQHVAECPHCTRELLQLQNYLTALAPTLEVNPPSVITERVRVLIAHLADSIAGMAPLGGAAPALAGLRGEPAQQYVYEAEHVQVILEVQPDLGHADRKEILGLILGLENAQPLEAHLWQTDQRLATVTIDELGNFVFSALQPGPYELILSSADLEIHIQDVLV